MNIQTVTSATNLPQVTRIEPAQQGVRIVELTTASTLSVSDIISIEIHACREVSTTPPPRSFIKAFLLFFLATL